MTVLDELIQELCPDGVKYKALGEICKLVTGATPSKTNAAYWENGTIPWMSSGEVNLKRVAATEKKITQLGYEKNSTTIVPKHSVVIALAGQGKPRGKAAITEIELCTNQSLCSMICNENLDYKFLYYILDGKYEELRAISNGDGTRGGLSLKILAPYKIPVPPLPVQREIVHILDNFTELTAELTARKQQYAYYRDKLLTPRTDYRHVKIIDMLKQPITDGPHTTPELMEYGIPFLSVEAVFDGKIHFEKRRGNITPEFDAECCKKYKPQKYDIFMVKSGSTTGKVGYVDTDERFNIWSPLAAMRVNSENSSRYLFHLLQSKMVQQQVVAKASHGSQPNLSMRALEQFDVVIPPLDIQLRLANVLDNFDSICTDLSSGLPAEIEARQKQYEYYRDKLLSFTPAD